MTILTQIQELLRDECGLEADDYGSTTNFINDIGMDSIDFMEFIVITEDHFQIDLNVSDVDRVKTLGDLVLLIEEQTKQ